jgi:hypothetical protein
MTSHQRLTNDIYFEGHSAFFKVFRSYCAANKLSYKVSKSVTGDSPVVSYLGGGGLHVASFRTHNSKLPTLVKLVYIPDTVVQDLPPVPKPSKPFPPSLLHVILPTRSIWKDHFLIVQRRFLPETLLQRVRFPSTSLPHLLLVSTFLFRSLFV